MEGLIVHIHLYEHVAGVALARRGLLLAVAHLNNLLGGHQDLTKLVLDTCTRDRVLKSEFRLVLVSRMRCNDVPVHANDPSVPVLVPTLR